jgi:hypothetical protein
MSRQFSRSAHIDRPPSGPQVDKLDAAGQVSTLATDEAITDLLRKYQTVS